VKAPQRRAHARSNEFPELLANLLSLPSLLSLLNEFKGLRMTSERWLLSFAVRATLEMTADDSRYIPGVIIKLLNSFSNDGNDGNGRRGDGRGDNGGRGYNERPQGGFGERPQRPPMEFAPGQNGPGRRPGFGGPPFGPPPMNPDRRGTLEEQPLDPLPADAPAQP